MANQNQIFAGAYSEQNGRPVGRVSGTPQTNSVTLTASTDGNDFRLTGTKFYSTGTLFADWTSIIAAGPDDRSVQVTVPVDREGVTLLDDWDGFGQRLTGTGTTKLQDVRVSVDEFADFESPTGEAVPTYQGAFFQLYLQALTAGVLACVADDAVDLVRGRKRSFSHAAAAQPAQDPQVLQVVGEISADAFAATVIVLAAAEALQHASDSVTEGRPTPEAALGASLAAAKAKVAIDRFSYATAARLFDAGGASATQAVRNLDRHWRNVRTISTHNPTFLKATAIGDFLVNGTEPPRNGYF